MTKNILTYVSGTIIAGISSLITAHATEIDPWTPDALLEQHEQTVASEGAILRHFTTHKAHVISAADMASLQPHLDMCLASLGHWTPPNEAQKLLRVRLLQNLRENFIAGDISLQEVLDHLEQWYSSPSSWETAANRIGSGR